MFLQLLDEAGVVGLDEVDSGTLSTETTSSTDSVDVVLLLEGKLVVDDETNLLHINTSSEQIGGNKNTDGTGSELLHDGLSLELVHLTVHNRDNEVFLDHSLLELLDTLFGVTVDESLIDIKVSIEVEEYLHLPFLLFDGNIVLADTFKGQFLVLNKDLGGVSHEVLGKLEHIVRHGSGEQSNLDVLRQVLKDVGDLFLETTREHLISLIENEQSQVVGLHETSLHHIVNTTGSTDDDVNATLENTDIVLNQGTTDTSVDLDLHELTDGVDDISNLHSELTGRGKNDTLNVSIGSINDLQGSDCECTSFTGTRLSLSNCVLLLNNW